jgi:aminoglycoside phosphotransferase (APT) family kinase protein
MNPPKMHPDEIGVGRSLVMKLIASQFPDWSDLDIRPANSVGTDNAIFRLGDHLGIRLPKIHWAVHQVDTEFRLLARLAPELPVQLPLAVEKGEPGMGYPFAWLIYEWLDGEDLEMADNVDPVQLARDLAGFVTALRQIDPNDAPEYRRPLSGEDAATREALSAIAGSFDTGRLLELWTEAVDAEPWSGPPVWLHGDLLPGNILLAGGRLSGIIDWSATGAGDPARDLMIAWALPPYARDAYRRALSPDNATWTRARGWVITQCAQYIPYYAQTIPTAVDGAKRRLQAVLDET